jgi:ubiquitin C-terminal hydrolase
LSGHGRYFCESCGEVQRATKSTKIGKLPPVLCLHLKRFTWRGNASRTKITNDVDFPLDNLDLAPYSEFDEHRRRRGIRHRDCEFR